MTQKRLAFQSPAGGKERKFFVVMFKFYKVGVSHCTCPKSVCDIFSGNRETGAGAARML